MKYLIAILGFGLSYFIIKKREGIGNAIGDYDWMRYVGGVYNLMVIIAILIFLWSLATITGTTEFFFGPLLWVLRGGKTEEVPVDTGGF